MIKAGKITHYYNNIGVAVIDVLKPIKKGDRIRISGHDKEFDQIISSMENEHKQVDKVKSGDDIGMKVDQEVKIGDVVYKL